MSQFLPAFDYTMYYEDRARTWLPKPDNNGYQVIAGINARWFPQVVKRLLAMAPADRLSTIQDFYQAKFWRRLGFACLASQDIANRVFDQSVNGGSFTAIQMLQQCCTEDGETLAEDGRMGPITCMSANSVDGEKLLAQYRDAREAHYRSVADHNPADLPDLDGWIVRARG